MSLGDEAACINQLCKRKSSMACFSVAPSCGHFVPGKRLRKPVLEPKYCHDNAASRSKLFAKIGSKCADHVFAEWTSESELSKTKYFFFPFYKKEANGGNFILTTQTNTRRH